METNRVGEHFFPPAVKTVRLDEKQLREGKLDLERLSGYRPGHLAMRPIPERLPRALQVPRWLTREEGQKDDLGEPGTIFAPDTRYVFSDTSFPWCTCGRVQTASGWGSGVMIGPRHMMTASHVINWGPNNTAGWVKFTPLQFDTSEPFGFAYVTRIYWWQQVNGSDGINSNEAAFDYVVCILDRESRNITGWMGSRGYSSDWNGGAYGHTQGIQRTWAAAYDRSSKVMASWTAPSLSQLRGVVHSALCTVMTIEMGSPEVPPSDGGQTSRGRALSQFTAQ